MSKKWKQYRNISFKVSAVKYSKKLDLGNIMSVKHCEGTHGHVHTREGLYIIQDGEWLVQREGRYYPMTDEEFKKTFMVVQ